MLRAFSWAPCEVRRSIGTSRSDRQVLGLQICEWLKFGSRLVASSWRARDMRGDAAFISIVVISFLPGAVVADGHTDAAIAEPDELRALARFAYAPARGRADLV